MKELSIEEKAEAYDVLLTKAKQIYNKENDVLIKHTIEDLFPEVRKNEDEKMKESCKFFLNLQKINSPHSISDIDKCIVWLDKQDEQKLDNKVEPKFHEGEWITIKE